MPQSPKEIVRAALHFQTPERLPVKMGGLGVNDTQYLPRPEKREQVGEYMVDEWGCGWGHTHVRNMGQVVSHPLTDVSQHDQMTTPDYNESWRYEELEAAARSAEEKELYTDVGIFFVLFERFHGLVGFENALTGIMLDPENACAMLDKIVDVQLTLVRNYQERIGERLHGFTMTDDWGTQQAAFISIDKWREIFLPRYKRLFDAIHEGGQDVWVHSCGKVNEIIEGYIEAGVNIVNLQQPRALGIEAIGRRYRERIGFESLSDIQATLPTGDRARIEADARALAEHWMSPKGGFVFSDYGDSRAIGTTDDSKYAMYEAFSRVSQKIYGKPLPALQK
ncbi:MAG: uroporphyrinogen decarboxylase family protein [Candidatus Sumerlaeota bacterium]